jgi:hypothetical protein
MNVQIMLMNVKVVFLNKTVHCRENGVYVYQDSMMKILQCARVDLYSYILFIKECSNNCQECKDTSDNCTSCRDGEHRRLQNVGFLS